jgi:ABC-type lipoprotein release transport system permease subunit
MKIAWRNIWRNRRRAVITMASVFFAVFFCVVMMGFSEGVWESMIDNMLRMQTGHIQIHGKEYWDDKITDNFMFMDKTTISSLENINFVENVSPRIETFAMSSFGTVSKGIAVMGVSPEKEKQKSNLPSRIVAGDYLTETDDGILIGEGLSKYLKASIGDTLALIGQGYHGASAAQLFVIRGILKFMTVEMDNTIAYITLTSAQSFIDMPDGYSGILISITDNKRLDEVMRVISCRLQVETDNDPFLQIYPWQFTMERLLQTSESDKAFSTLIMYILYVIVGFGILGTVIMMTNERKREFCIMISLGMPRIRLAAVIVVELLMMILIGVTLALIVTLPVAHWFAAHPIEITGEMGEMYATYGMEPILPMSTRPYIFVNQIITVLIIAILTVIYPVNRILRLKIVKGR